VQQQPQTTFVYIMPFSVTRALVEYTIFSAQVAPDAIYERELQHYINHFLRIQEFSIIEKEGGIIPMTNFSFPGADGRVIHIGTAGGQTKASSGYTFQFIQKQTQQLVNNLLRNGSPFPVKQGSAGRFTWYDGTLLNILSNNKLPGSYIFTQLFRKNKATDVLRFLDNETSILEELKIIRGLPTGVFMQAAWQQLF
jgi:lycopene beta-cyclase